jgi:hypothetical protein
VIASHWHDDHVRGLAALVEQCASARFFYPAAFGSDEFQTFAQILNSADPSPFAKETSEIVRTFSHVADARRLVGAVVVDRLLLQMGDIEVFALSPDDDQFKRFVASVARVTPAPSPPTRRTRIGALPPNDTAIVVQVKTPVGQIILGSDLEEIGVRGWSTMIAHAVALKKQNVVLKVAHHGSANAHCDDFWAQYRAEGCIAVLTPFTRGSVALPTGDDVARIEALGSKNYITARSIARPAVRRPPEVSRALRESQIKIRRAQPKPGHVRLRAKIAADAQWDVALFEGATPLAQEVAA